MADHHAQAKKLHGFHLSKEERDAERKKEAQEKKEAQLDKLDEKKLQVELDALSKASFLAPHQKERKMKVENWLHALRKRREAAEEHEQSQNSAAEAFLGNAAGDTAKRGRQLSSANEDEDDDDDIFGERRARHLAEMKAAAEESARTKQTTIGSSGNNDDNDHRWSGVLSFSNPAQSTLAPASLFGQASTSYTDINISSGVKSTATSFMPRHLVQRQQVALAAAKGNAAAGAIGEGDGADAASRQAKMAEQRILDAAEKAEDEGESLDDILDGFA